MSESDPSTARLVGINHVVLEVGDLEEALEFYGTLVTFDLRGRTAGKAFVDAGDQFLVLAEVEGADRDRDGARHVGLVVDDAEAVERKLESLDVEFRGTSGRDFVDPWGNRVQIVGYRDIQFTKADHVLRGMGLGHLEKSDEALDELAEKGIAPE